MYVEGDTDNQDLTRKINACLEGENELSDFSFKC